MATDSKLINQGSYGCIYYPSLPFQVKRNKKNSHKTPWDALKSTHELRSKYVSKLQKFNFHSDFEDHIGRKIQEIPSYELFFVPVLKTYKIDLATIKEKHVTGCDAISKYIRRNVRKSDQDQDQYQDQDQDQDQNQDQPRDRKLTTNDYKILNKNFIIQKMKYINGVYLHRYLLDVVKYSETTASSASTDASKRYKIFSSGSDASSSASSSEASDDNYTDEPASKEQLTKTLRKDERQIAKYRTKFKKEENNTSSYNLLSILFDLYERITDSVQVLIKYKIVHYDLKENNILVEKRHQLPYIIDFGLSIDIARLQEHPWSEKQESHSKSTIDSDILYHTQSSRIFKYNYLWRQHFYVHAPDYFLWPIEVHLMTYLINENDTLTY